MYNVQGTPENSQSYIDIHERGSRKISFKKEITPIVVYLYQQAQKKTRLAKSVHAGIGPFYGLIGQNNNNRKRHWELLMSGNQYTN